MDSFEVSKNLIINMNSMYYAILKLQHQGLILLPLQAFSPWEYQHILMWVLLTIISAVITSLGIKCESKTSYPDYPTTPKSKVNCS